ncbi:hypothetical protein K402DRAFT_314006, partial [Aulographum hederae CBS 113979]
RGRKRGGSASDGVKHKRTRSGCFTCRNRRVKCDEKHPICERCRKGNRECIYPEPSSSSKPRRTSSKPKGAQSDSPSSIEEADDEGNLGLETIIDDEETASSDLSRPTSLGQNALTGGREASDPPSLTHGKSPTPSTEGSASASRHGEEFQRPRMLSRRSTQLPRDIEFYIDFHRKNITSHHYGLKIDSSNFFGTTYVEIALRSDPLLYALVGFSAYHYALTQPNTQIQEFLQYYNKAVTLLRLSLKQHKQRTVATLLTILQLATIEERLGDWVNLMSHQKAACQIMTELWNPQTIMQNDTLRKTLAWYSRFDVIAGMLAGHSTILGRDWFSRSYDYFSHIAQKHPDNIGILYEQLFSWSRLCGYDIAVLFARKAKGLVSDEEYTAERSRLEDEVCHWQSKLSPKLTDPSNQIPNDPNLSHQQTSDDLFNPAELPRLFKNEYWVSNIALMSLSALEILFRYNVATAEQTAPPQELFARAMLVCQMFEAIQRYPDRPVGSVLSAAGDLGMSVLCLPREPRYTMWSRRKLADVESLGYTYPDTMRKRMSEAWNVDLSQGWLPDVPLPPFVQRLRAFIAERARLPRDQ